MSIIDNEERQALTWVRDHMPREAAYALSQFTLINPGYDGAGWDDVLAVLLNADAYLSVTEPLHEDDELKDYGMVPAAVAITLMYASKVFSSSDSDRRLLFVKRTITNNGGCYVPKLHDSYQVVQVVHVPMDRNLYTAEEAVIERDRLSAENPDRSYVIVTIKGGVLR